MSFSLTEKRRVFLACRPIFTGSHAQLRREKRVRKVVVQHRQALKQLLADLGENKVVEILRVMLEKRIFESEIQARACFPDLFSSSSAKTLQRAETENDAAKSVAELIDEIECTERDVGLQEIDAATVTAPDLPNTHEKDPKTHDVSEISQPTILSVPTLYPLYFPYSTQHKILNAAQVALEESCFEFAQKWLPQVVQSQDWDCAAAVELTKWSKTFKQHSNKIPNNALTLIDGLSLDQLLAETHRLRHAAVHRLPTTAREINKFIFCALQLSQALQDSKRMSQFDELHLETENKIKAMELSKNALEEALRLELESIAAKRRELDQQELNSIQRMLVADQENKTLIGNLLGDIVTRLFEPSYQEEEDSESCSDGEGTQVPEIAENITSFNK